MIPKVTEGSKKHRKRRDRERLIRGGGKRGRTFEGEGCPGRGERKGMAMEMEILCDKKSIRAKAAAEKDEEEEEEERAIDRGEDEGGRRRSIDRLFVCFVLFVC